MTVTSVARPTSVATPVVRWCRRALCAGVLACLVAALVLALAPTAVGGSTSYVVTEGTSMLPSYRADGVVLTRVRPDYRVGDVVAYHNRELGAVVMHRIVERRGDGYVFQGDNNDYRDDYIAREGDLIGEEWVYLPGVGRAVAVLRSPLAFGGLIGLVAFVSFLVPLSPRRSRRRHGG